PGVGDYALTYAVGPSACAEIANLTITVRPDVDATLTRTTDTLCLASANTINLTSVVSGTAGGTWTGTGVSGTTFTSPGVGDYVLTYSVGLAPCAETSSITITVNPDVDATLTRTTDTLCLA